LTERARIDFRIRFFLGGVAGLAISWFLAPSTDRAPGSNLAGLGAIGSLSPLVLSFVAGYAVEIFFSVIDRVISGFRDTAPQSDGAP
jgi:hypothetical protein